MEETMYLSRQELEAGLKHIRQSPVRRGTVEMIVRRPRTDEREVLEQAELDVTVGLVGDNWHERGSLRMPGRSTNPETQITIINSRLIALIAREKSRWPLAGDQLYVDLDLSTENLRPGTRLAVGSAVVEVTAPPHTGCKKFMARFGEDAVKFVNSPTGKALHLRGINARVIQAGTVHVGDPVEKIS